MSTTNEKRLARRKKTLVPFSELYYKMRGMMCAMPPRKLKFLRESAEAMTNSNCSWAAYHAAQYLKWQIADPKKKKP